LGDIDASPSFSYGAARDWHPLATPWLRVQRLIRSILEVRRDTITRSVMKATLTKALREREKIRRAGWWNWP